MESTNLSALINPSEFEIQTAIVDWLEANQFVYFAVPNGELRTKSTGAKLKRMGVKRGVPDLFICHTSKHSSGLFLEVKSKSGSLSVDQKFFKARLELNSYTVAAVKSLEQAIDCIARYVAS